MEWTLTAEQRAHDPAGLLNASPASAGRKTTRAEDQGSCGGHPTGELSIQRWRFVLDVLNAQRRLS